MPGRPGEGPLGETGEWGANKQGTNREHNANKPRTSQEHEAKRIASSRYSSALLEIVLIYTSISYFHSLPTRLRAPQKRDLEQLGQHC